MTNTQMLRRINKVSLDEVVQTLRNKGFTVRYYGFADDLAYEVFSLERGYAIRNEAQMRNMLAGFLDPFFGLIN